MAPIIGIDLGTTNSCAAYCDDAGEVHLIEDRGGQFTIPSVFAIDSKGNELVGHEAKRQWQLNPKNTVYGAKRLIGTQVTSELAHEMRNHVTYDFAAGDQNDVVVEVAGHVFRMHELAGRVLKRMRDLASEAIGSPVDRAVVTVPAYFTDRQRQTVREAGQSVGLEVVRVINEPTAAALAYGARRNTEQTLAVYDLGGGTFDISVIEVRNHVFEVRATGGDIFLGGIDFDNALISYLATDFQAKNGVDLRSDPVAMQRLRDLAERAKIDLSVRNDVQLHLPFVAMSASGQPLDVEMNLDKNEFETLVSHLVDQTFVAVERVVDDAGLQPADIDAVLLVGGQTRMPIIQQRILDFFGTEPSKAIHPDEAVARGAALYAHSLEHRSGFSLQLLDVLPMAIGIEGVGGAMHRLFERNTSIPHQRQFTFTTHREDQADLRMRIYQGDDPIAASNALLGDFVFAGLRRGPAGSVRVEVVFDVNEEGILGLAARDLDTGAEMQQTVRLGTAA